MTTTIGRYQIIRPLGAGGMADVYLAQDPTLGRQVAIKVIGSGRFDANLLARFMREARTVANLEHPAIVPLYDYGEQDGRPYLVMRYMAGGSLSERIARRPLSLAEATTVVSRIAAALDFAHAQGIIHRDVKPDNILFDDAGAAYLSDFGIARYAAIGTGKSLTSTGAVIGTTAYMSPEQALGKGDLDGRSDLYSLGAVLFEALSGDVPYKADSALQQAMLHINAPIPDIRARRPDLPPVTQTIISRVLAKEPQARYQSAAALTGDLRRVTTGVSPANRNGVPGWIWLIGFLGLAVLAFIFFDSGNDAGTEPAAAIVPIELVATDTPTPTNEARSSNTIVNPPVPTATVTSTPAPAAQPVAGDTRIVDRAGLAVEQVLVPAGRFRMGTDGGKEEEKPIHEVSIDTFWIDKTEVTNAQFEAFVQTMNLATTAERDGYGHVYTTDSWRPLDGADWQHPQGPGSAADPDHPVVLVTWEEASGFCAWAGGRLPTEAEWEYAARGPESLPFPWGLERDNSLFNSCDVNCPYDWRDTTADDGFRYTAPVGSYSGGASWVGALDMVGNVWEWVNDWYDENTYSEELRVNPTGPESGTLRVIRGVAWVHGPGIHYSANRGRAFPNQAYNGFGFRCAGDELETIADQPTTVVTPPPVTAEGARLLEEFNYSGNGSLNDAYRINAPGNDLTLSLAPSAVGGQALAMIYTINNTPPSDYVGVEADRAPMDWRGFNQVCVWVQNDGFNGHMVFQFREMSATTWKAAVRLGGISSETICIPLNTDTFENFSDTSDTTMDLQAIDNYAIYLGDGGIDSGTFLVDNLHLSP